MSDWKEVQFGLRKEGFRRADRRLQISALVALGVAMPFVVGAQTFGYFQGRLPQPGPPLSL